MPPKAKPDTVPAETPAPVDTGTGDIRAAGEKRKAAAANEAEPGSMLAALFDERRGYVTRGGMDDRVAQVDAQIRRHGGTPPTD